ncbi:hypothetical protein SUGI_0379570 [Cryptomeria japonica]|nr:hypothetical protein SUGI_0379570 [Cryptomeria japonica]
MIQSAYTLETHVPLLVRTSRVASSSSSNFPLNTSLKAQISGQGAELLGTRKKRQNSIHKRAELRVNPLLQTDGPTLVELQRLPKWSEVIQRNSPTASPKESLDENWTKYQGSNNWEGLVEPLSPKLRREILKYGEFA